LSFKEPNNDYTLANYISIDRKWDMSNVNLGLIWMVVLCTYMYEYKKDDTLLVLAFIHMAFLLLIN
jgi:hypothetical protein